RARRGAAREPQHGHRRIRAPRSRRLLRHDQRAFRDARRLMRWQFSMRHRISAGVIVDVDDRILLVRHVRPGIYDFWVAPGGGVEGTEDLRAAIRREAHEECGLEVEPMQIAYVEDLWAEEMRICKLWFIGRITGGALTSQASGAAAEHIVDARFV